jgi:HD-GYP domain-containing protein (c-di-GMP phosphodiesterase class II)
MAVFLGKDGRKQRTVQEAPRIPASQTVPAAGAARLGLEPRSPLMSEVVLALAPLFDAIEGHEAGHTVRTAIIGMHLARLLDLGQLASADLFFALLLKDLGGAGARAQSFHVYGVLDGQAEQLLQHADLTDLTKAWPLLGSMLGSKLPLPRRLRNAADLLLGARKQPSKIERTRSRLASALALEMGFSHGTAAAVRSQNERWDGRGRPDGLAGDTIPLGARVLAVAQELALLAETEAPEAALARLDQDSGQRFDPMLVGLAARLTTSSDLFEQLATDDLHEQLLDLEPPQRRHVALAGRVDRLLTGVARLIDSRSSWTGYHSERVRDLATAAAQQLQAPYRLSVTARRRLARAALLHDAVRLTAPVALVERPGKLNSAELAQVRGGAPFRGVIDLVLDLADDALITETFILEEAAAHQDGGRHLGSNEARLLTDALVQLCDRFEALINERPQRPALQHQQALELLGAEVEQAGAQEPDGAGPDWQRVALNALSSLLAGPSAATLLTPRRFDANAIVTVD